MHSYSMNALKAKPQLLSDRGAGKKNENNELRDLQMRRREEKGLGRVERGFIKRIISSEKAEI